MICWSAYPGTGNIHHVKNINFKDLCHKHLTTARPGIISWHFEKYQYSGSLLAHFKVPGQYCRWWPVNLL